MNMSEAKSSIDGKWVGECKAGQQPGDITLEIGTDDQHQEHDQEIDACDEIFALRSCADDA